MITRRQFARGAAGLLVPALASPAIISMAPRLFVEGAASGDNNPDSITAYSTMFVSKDYETEVAGDCDGTTLCNYEWGSTLGYLGTGGWRTRPNPNTSDPDLGENEDTGGLGNLTIDFGSNEKLICVGLMIRWSGEFLDCITARPGGFMSRMLKAFDMGNNGDNNRIGCHFGASEDGYPAFVIAGTGGGDYTSSQYDWRAHADQWVWVCFLVDARGATSADRYVAFYIKPTGATDVTRIVRVYENDALGPLGNMLNASGSIGAFTNTGLFGFWDRMGARAAVEASFTLNAMTLDQDVLRIANGWVDPPF